MPDARPEIHLHIERLTLEGLPLTRAHGPALQAALEAELTRLLTEGGLPEAWSTGNGAASLSAGGLTVEPHTDAGTTGTRIAHAVYGSVRR